MLLTPHPQHRPLAVSSVRASVSRYGEDWVTLRWRIEHASALIVPPFASKGRADGLWKATCFELFIASEGPGAYAEFNLSPSDGWAAYDFTGYREGMTNRQMPRDPVCTFRRGGRTAIFDAAIPTRALPALPWHYGLSAVLQEDGGITSFWALAHSEGKPDFHDPACFTAMLAAPDAP